MDSLAQKQSGDRTNYDIFIVAIDGCDPMYLIQSIADKS
jgi:hypothetical protein